MASAAHLVILTVCWLMWLLAGTAESRFKRHSDRTMLPVPIELIPPTFKKICFRDEEYEKAMENTVAGDKITPFLYMRRHAIELPKQSIYQEEQFSVHCTMLLKGSDMVRLPVYCRDDIKGCHQLTTPKLRRTHKAHRGKGAEVKLRYFSNRAYSRNCHCTLIQQIGQSKFRVQINATMRWRNRYAKDSKLEKDDQFNLVVPREQAIIMPPDMGDFSLPPVLSPLSVTYLTNYPAQCAAERASVPPPKLLIQDGDLMAFSVTLANEQRLCPATRIRKLALKITPQPDCRVSADLSQQGRSRNCPSLGYVYFVLPFPWNSHLVRDLGMVAKSGHLMAAAFYLPLPLHVTQHMVPGQKYDVEQVVLDTLYKPDVHGGLDGLSVSKQAVTLTYPDPSGGCFAQLDLISKNLPSDLSSYCPSPIDLDTKSSPFSTSRVDFRVKAYMFCVTLVFEDNGAKSRLSITFAENFVMYEKKTKVIRLLKMNPFQMETYSVALAKGKVVFQQIGVPLFAVDMKLSGSAKIITVSFGYPGYCQARSNKLNPNCPWPSSIAAMKNTYHTAKIQLVLPNCGPGRCVQYRSSGAFRTPSKDSYGSKPVWLFNLRPSWSWVHAIGVYGVGADIMFAESSAGTKGDPHGLRIKLARDKPQAFMGDKSIPFLINKLYEATTTEQILKDKARGIYTDYTGAASAGPLPAQAAGAAPRIATFMYLSWDMFTVEMGLADMRSPYVRAYHPDASASQGGVTVTSLEEWNLVTSPVASGASPRSALLRYVVQEPCVLEDARMFTATTPRLDGTPPACMFGTVLTNYPILTCIAVHRCGAQPFFDRQPHRAALPSCLYDPHCSQSGMLSKTADEYQLMSGYVDFAIESPTTMNVPFTDMTGALDNDGSMQILMMQFMPNNIAIQRVYGGFRSLGTFVLLPMQDGYLEHDNFHGFRLMVNVSQSSSSVRLFDLQNMRPDAAGQDVWSHNFNERLLLSHIYFHAHVTDKKRNSRDSHVIIDCVPDFDICAGPNPCFNGGTCKHNKCICKPGYYGDKCQINSCEQSKIMCQNGGTCVPIDVTPYWACQCDTQKWTGKLCEIMFDYCYSKPCQNGGTCQPEVGDWTCKCPRRFAGRFCHVNTDACSRLKPCKNGATCSMDDSDSDDSFKCACPKRFAGKFCRISQAYRAVLFHTKKGMALSGFPLKLVAQSQGAQPFRCFIDLKDNNFIDVESEDFKQSQMNRRRLWARQGFDVSQYRYRGGFSLKEFVHIYVHPGTYNISVKCTNQGYDAPVYVQPAEITPNANPNLCVPSVDVRNSGLTREEAPSYYRRDTLRLYAIAKSDCPKVEIDQVRWSVHPITDKTPYPAEGSQIDLSHVPLTEHHLSVPAFTFTYGLWAAKMRADAYIRSLGTVSSYEVGWFRVVPHPLQCVLSGGDRLSMPRDDVSLDGTLSHDPDNSDGKLRGVVVEWRCWRFPSGQTDSYCLGKQRPLAGKGLRLKAISTRMEVHRQYVFELTLRHEASVRLCHAQQIVNVAPDGTSRAAIICQYNCQGGADWQDKISFRAECPNCPGDFTVLWKITTLGGVGGIINWREDTSFGANNKHLIINAKVLKPAGKYQISVHVAKKGEGILDSGTAQMTTLRLRSVPSNGSCHTHPPEGIAGVTPFRLHCEDWQSDSLPLSYLFMQERIDGGGYNVLYEDINPLSENVTLSFGNPKANYATSIRVRVTDASGMWAFTDFNITVRPPVTIAVDPVIKETRKVFKLLPSGFDKIEEAVRHGNIPRALQNVGASASLLNQITNPNAEEVAEVDTKRKLRQKLVDSLDDIKPTSLGSLQQTADAISEVASGHRDEYYPATVEKLINHTEKLSEMLRDNYGKDKSVSPKLIHEAGESVLRTLSSTLGVATEDVKPPSLKPVDLVYPNNERDYDVFDEERIDHVDEKRQRVARVVDKFMSTTNNVYEALGKHMEPGEKPKKLISHNIDMWLQTFNNRTALNSTVAGLPPGKQITEKDSNYVLIPGMAGIISDQPDDVKSVEVTVTTMKKNPYWWDEESAKNITTNVVNVNLRGIPGYKSIKVGGMKERMDIFLKRSTTDVVRVTGRVMLLDWFETLNHRRNYPRDTDVMNHKIVLPAGGYSQIIQLIPIPQIALAKDRKRKNITYEIPVKVFMSYRKDEKASIHNMKHSYLNRRARKRWTIPKNRQIVAGREVDVFTVIHQPPPMSGTEVEEWYLGTIMHPETGKRLLNGTVLVPISGHKRPHKPGHKHRLPGEIPIPVYSDEEEEEMRLSMGRSVMRSREQVHRFVEDPSFTALPGDDAVFSSRGGWLMPRRSRKKEAPSNISSIYRDDVIGSLDRKEICRNTLTFHDCERHQSVSYNLTLFAARCMYWSDELSQFTDKGCEVGELSTVDVLHCRCDHLTAFAGSFLVLPNKVDRVHAVNNNMLLSLNFSSVFLMIALMGIYIMLFMYARKQDLRDVKRRQIVYVDDNDPSHQYAYLVTVYTGVQYKSGTTARVAIVLVGDGDESDTHLLTGEKKRRRTLERGSDSWFLITTESSLGDLQQLRIWHDNSGKNPEWFLDRVLVRDCRTDEVWIFLVGRWVHPVTGLLVTARPAALHEMVAWNTSVSRRAEESLRDGHLWFSVFSRPLNSPFTRCQRLASATTLLTANIVASLAFYGIPTGDATDQISRTGTFGISVEDLIISIESAVIVTVLVAPVVFMFRRARPLEDVKRRAVVMETAEGEDDQQNTGNPEKAKKEGEVGRMPGANNDKTSTEAKSTSKVSIENSEKPNNAANDEADGGIQPPFEKKEGGSDQAEDEIVVDNGEGNGTGSKGAGSQVSLESQKHHDPDARRPTLVDLNKKVDGGPTAAHDLREGYKLPWWFVYIAWVLSSLVIGFSVMLSINWSMSFGKVKCYIWLASSGISLLQSVIIIQPLLIVVASWLCTYACGVTPEVENRKTEQPQQKMVDDKLAKQYAETIRAKRTLPMYHQIPAKKLRKLRAEKMKGLLTRGAIKDIVTFLVYIACLLLIIHSSKDPNAYYSTQTARNMFIRGNMVKDQDDCVKFKDATDMGAVYKYINTTFIRTLHHTKDYNGNDDRHDGMTTQGSLFFIGVVRLRQVRVTREPCHTADQLFWMNFTSCKQEFAWRLEDNADYGQNWSPDPTYHSDPWTNEASEAWLYKNATYLRALPYVGEYATYPGSGYTLHLGRNIKSSEVVLKYVADSSWFDAYTRALFIEFTLYNADCDLFNLVVLLFEQTGVGTVSPSYSIRTSKLLIRADAVNKIDLYMTGFYVVFILFNTVVEARRVRKLGIRAYVTDKWNVLDFLLVAMGYVCIGLYVYRYIVVDDAIQNLRNTDENKFANFYIPVFWDYVLTYAQAFALLLTMAKFWKILTFNKRMVTFSLTLKYSRRDLKAFFVVFFITILAYAYWGTIMFGMSVQEFQDMWSALISLILFSIGTFDASTYVSADRFFGPAFFALYVFFVMIYLINVMLSIIMAGYEMAMDDMQHLETKYDVIDVFIWEVRNFFEDSSSDSDDEGEVVTARKMRRRRIRNILRKAMPCCVSDTRRRDLRRPVEQEELWQLQRFMSRTAASGIPYTMHQDLGSIASEEDATILESSNRGRRQGMMEPEDEYDDEEIVMVKDTTEGEAALDDTTAASAAQGSAQRFLLDKQDVDVTGHQLPRDIKIRHRRPKKNGPNHQHHRKSRLPSVPQRKSVQHDPRFLPSLTVAPEDMPSQGAHQRLPQDSNRRTSTGSNRRTSTSSNRRASTGSRGTAAGARRSTGAQRPPFSAAAGYTQRPARSGQGGPLSGTHRSSAAGQTPTKMGEVNGRSPQADSSATNGLDPFRSRIRAINNTLSYVEVEVEKHASQLNNVVI